jgi:hypothetical protein
VLTATKPKSTTKETPMSDNTNNAPAMLPGDASNLRVTLGDGAPQIEFLQVADSVQLSHSADVQHFPSGEEFQNEIDGHNKAITALQARLDEKTFDPRTGQAKGHSYEGEARRHLELQLNNRKAALDFTSLQRAHQAAEARASKAAQRAADNQPSDDTTSLYEQARRESLIAQTAADIGPDGKPLGRVRATALVDDELNRERVAARVRASR